MRFRDNIASTFTGVAALLAAGTDEAVVEQESMSEACASQRSLTLTMLDDGQANLLKNVGILAAVEGVLAPAGGNTRQAVVLEVVVAERQTNWNDVRLEGDGRRQSDDGDVVVERFVPEERMEGDVGDGEVLVRQHQLADLSVPLSQSHFEVVSGFISEERIN